MAPKLAKNKNKQNGTKKQPAMDHDGQQAGTTDYAQQQKDEIEVLQSIYMDDFSEIETKSAWGGKQTDRAFQIRLKPLMQTDVDVSITLLVRLSATYPKSVPSLELRNASGIRQDTTTRIQAFAIQKAKELLGEVMIYEITAGIQDILEDEAQFKLQDKALPSLEEQRVAQAAASIESAKREAEAAQKLKQEAQAEEDKLLQKMVEEEMQRRREAKRRTRPETTFTRDANSTTSLIHLDRTVHYQFGELDIQFSGLTTPMLLTKGPLTEISIVQPAMTDTALSQSCLLVVKQLYLEASSASQKKQILKLEDELESLRKLHHPSVAQVFDFRLDFTDKWSMLVLMQYARKGSLADHLNVVGTLTPTKVRIWLVELLEGLDFLHKSGIVHQRIHANNVLLVQVSTSAPVQIQLSDAAFQQSLYNIKAAYAQKTAATSFSASWTAPEAEEKNAKTDVWDMGIVFLQMLFGLDTQRKYSSASVMLEELSLTAPLEDIISRFFRPNARSRPSAFDMIPSEFLRTEAAVYSRPSSPLNSRHGSMVLTQTSSRQRIRRRSSDHHVATFSRYSNEWIEIGRLGKGGFGEVVKARNKMDGGIYAIKKIKQKTASALSGVLSEVMLLSRLNHPYVVRYFTAWPEEEEQDTIADSEESTSIATTTEDEILSLGQFPVNASLDFGQSTTGGLDFISEGFPKIRFGSDSDDDSDVSASDDEEVSSEAVTTGSRKKSLSVGDRKALHLRRTSSSRQIAAKQTLYIQMEYCERQTLRDLIRKDLDIEEMWRLFRQILEGLVHIHGHGIIHRDLKPDNIFIDFASNPKIGDFGLATSGQYQQAGNASSRAAGGDMTRSIGTTYYVAPELRSNVSGSYNDKVDMYSLGIIFFEMNVPLKTAMERDKAIRAIREKEHTLPAVFQQPDRLVQGAIVLSLISHKPSERPTSAELLKSGKIPIKIEDETIRRALEGLSDPTSPYYHQMMGALFSQGVDTKIKEYTWDMGATSGMHDANEGMLLMRYLVKDHLISIFQRHGAVETQRQQLIPRSAQYANNNNVVRLLDASGTLVQLPYDLILPHARAIARKYPATDKSFAFGNVFRETVVGGAPQSSGEVDFDIVSHDAVERALKEAEVIKVLDEIIDEFPGLASAQMCFHLNHADLLELILEYCRISIPQRQAVKEQVSRLNIADFDWPKIRNELRSPALAVPSTSLDDMARFNFRDAPEKAITRINTIFEGTVFQGRAKSCLKHLRDVVSYLKEFGINHKIFICPLSAINEKFYTGGIMFQCLYDRKKRAVLAAGGRYDRLIEEHRPKGQSTFTGCHAVGFNLSWDRLVVNMDKLVNNRTKASTFLKKKVSQDLGGAWKTRRCDVLVAAYDDAILHSDGLKVLKDLWASDISAELAPNARALNEIIGTHSDDNHSWLVIIKPDPVAGNRPDLRVRSTTTREEADVKYENLIGHLLSELRERDIAEGKGKSHRRQAAHSNDSQTTTSRRNQNVQVLVAQHRSKKSNKWNIVEAVQSRAQSLLQEYSNAPIAAIETKDDVLEMIRAARLSDPDSWRKVVHSVPLSERDYVQQIHQLLDGFRKEWLQGPSDGEEKSRMAFVSNFRTGHVVLYDLGL